MSCRLLYLVGQLRAGGLERQLSCLLEGMDRKRYRPEVVVWNFCEDDVFVPQIRALGVPLHSLRGASSRTAKLSLFRRLVRKIKPEIIHSYTFYTNFAARWVALGTKAISIGAVQSDFARAKKDSGLWLGRLNARWPRSQIFNSSTVAQTARKTRGLFVPKHLFVVRNGVNLQRFRSVSLSAAGRVCILGVGSLFPVKRWDRLLAAAQVLKRNGFDFLIRLVGDGPLREPLNQQAQALGVADRVEFIPYSDDIPDLLAEATFLVHTSDSEGLPNVVLEAMACGRAVVATNVGDVPDLVEDGKTGFVVRCGDDAMLVNRMSTLISNRDLCRRMGEAGRAKAEQGFGLDRLVEETLTAYRAAGWKDT